MWRLSFCNKKLTLLEAGKSTDIPALEQAMQDKVKQINDDRIFIEESNMGGEFMSSERQDRVKAIADYRWTTPDGKEEPFLSENEVYNLNIAKGTLSPEEREIINHHVVATKKMLSTIPFPKI